MIYFWKFVYLIVRCVLYTCDGLVYCHLMGPNGNKPPQEAFLGYPRDAINVLSYVPFTCN